MAESRNNSANNYSTSNNGEDDWGRTFVQKMLMRIEIDNVFQKYKNMNLFSTEELTLRDVALKVMMEEEIHNIKLKYNAIMSQGNEAPDVDMENDEEMPSTSRDEDPPIEKSKCCKKLEF